ncbi:hypothetical protein COL154_009127 [Colletotrichum chrysophilum]|uniref:uncharacterized protein n=1 Tax=Colletotrichum chrysophilum TaxID=1836956 RepID=UPI0023016146|nr:uncharacterized protein COL26b_012544 [Colletotrichum chrysophilum]KAJ0358501.1 hypothetical protein COL154_009127 [Colletotrichum chrysophilum]KAJ0364430.1 hypothetical protein COL26b_012544 [Colletotrichum chrysophilum]
MESMKRNETSGPQPSQRQHLFSAYEGSVMHDSPTLDEHYYHFAEDEDSTNDRKGRNRTQVISKYLHMGPYADESDMPRTILRVSQLWAWTIGDKWLVTSTSCAKVDGANTFVAEIRQHLRRRDEDGSLNGGLSSPQELCKIIAEYCIGVYERKHKLEKWTSDPSKIIRYTEERSIRQVFSDFINKIGREEADLFRQFSKQPVELDEKHSKAKDHSLTITAVLGATRKAANLLFQIKDVRDELHILKTVADYQEKVQNSLDEAIHSASNAAFEENMKAKYVRNDIDELDRLARNIQEAVSEESTLLFATGF